MHNEFVVEFDDGTRDWVDPVESIREDEHTIYVQHKIPGHVYEFKKSDIIKWEVRPYDPDTTYNWIK